MKHVCPLCLAAILSLCFAGLGFGEEKFAFDLKPTGNASMEFGNIVKGYDKNYGREPFNNVWMEKVFIGFGMQAIFSPVDTFRGAAEMKMFNEFPRTIDYGATRRLYHYPYIREAQAIHSFVNNDFLRISAGAGYFPYKYNSNVRNLGEFLFRSSVYPQTLTTEFDFPYARLLGFYTKSTFLNQLNCDFLISSNQEYMAVHDVNLSLLGSWNFNKIFEIGAGVSFCSILSADSNFTSPPNGSTQYIVDTLAKNKDTSYYTFAGTKLMARFSVDIKRLFTDDCFGGFLGEQDLRIYSEGAMLGLKDYPRALKSPIWYMSPLERMPVLFGFTWPTNPLLAYLSPVVPVGLSYVCDPTHNLTSADDVRLLEVGGAGVVLGAGTWWLERVLGKRLRIDELNIEAEWWGNRYPNSLQGVVIDGLPIPFRSGEKTVDSMMYKNDNWKWSIYGKKTFATHYQVIIQAASDHMRTFALEWSRQDWEESLRGPSNWYYVVKLGVLF